MATEYLVLMQAEGQMPEGDHLWEAVRKVEARSARAAISLVVDGTGSGEGIYVAVPTRSWAAVTVKVETKTALRFS